MARVQSLVGELRPHKPCGKAKKERLNDSFKATQAVFPGVPYQLASSWIWSMAGSLEDGKKGEVGVFLPLCLPWA